MGRGRNLHVTYRQHRCNPSKPHLAQGVSQGMFFHSYSQSPSSPSYARTDCKDYLQLQLDILTLIFLPGKSAGCHCVSSLDWTGSWVRSPDSTKTDSSATVTTLTWHKPEICVLDGFVSYFRNGAGLFNCLKWFLIYFSSPKLHCTRNISLNVLL